MLPYLLMFCRIAIGVTFAYSFLTKAQDVNQFARTIANFKLLPSQLSKPAATLTLIGELTAIALIAVVVEDAGIV
ncbi:MAG TPA: DoxX family membrane protein [Anaerolineae bacterium]|nr:DoxX family membrane protein [Anaerolineae bacterium]